MEHVLKSGLQRVSKVQDSGLTCWLLVANEGRKKTWNYKTLGDPDKCTARGS